MQNNPLPTRADHCRGVTPRGDLQFPPQNPPPTDNLNLAGRGSHSSSIQLWPGGHGGHRARVVLRARLNVFIHKTLAGGDALKRHARDSAETSFICFAPLLLFFERLTTGSGNMCVVVSLYSSLRLSFYTHIQSPSQL